MVFNALLLLLPRSAPTGPYSFTRGSRNKESRRQCQRHFFLFNALCHVLTNEFVVGHSSVLQGTVQNSTRIGTSMSKEPRTSPSSEMGAKHWNVARNSEKRKPIGLARLVERYLVLKLDKPKAVQISNWEKVLNERQQTCAFSLLSVLIGSDQELTST